MPSRAIFIPAGRSVKKGSPGAPRVGVGCPPTPTQGQLWVSAVTSSGEPTAREAELTRRNALRKPIGLDDQALNHHALVLLWLGDADSKQSLPDRFYNHPFEHEKRAFDHQFDAHRIADLIALHYQGALSLDYRRATERTSRRLAS